MRETVIQLITLLLTVSGYAPDAYPVTYRIPKTADATADASFQALASFAATSAWHAAIDVAGTVVDENNQPLPGATVKVKGGKQGAVTNNEGDFFLKGVREDAVLLIAYLGYKPLELKATANMGLIRLQQNAEELQEVVINKGYYETTKELNTGSVSKVDAKVIGQQPVTNPILALSGRMTGVAVQQTSGVPGSAVKIEIRGRNSLRDDGNEPLYVVDGVPFSSQTITSRNNYAGIIAGGISPFTSINSADIESIEVLKDADATAIYGSRGANGVVLITTKKGKVGKSKFDVNYYSGYGKVNQVKQLNTSQYVAMRKEAFRLEGLTPSANPDDSGTASSGYRAYAPDLMVWDTTRYTDWQKYFTGGTAKTASLQTSVSGGNESTQFLASAGYLQESSVFPGDSKYRKFSSHLSINHVSQNKKLFFNASVSGTLDHNDQPQHDFSLDSRIIAPNAPKLYDDNGNLNWENSTWQNPLAILGGKYKNEINFITSSATIGYEIIPGLKVRLKGGSNRSQSNETSVYPSTMTDPAQGVGSEASVVLTSNGTMRSFIIEPQLNWEKEFGKSALEVMVGGTYQQDVYRLTSLYFSKFLSNTLLNDISTAANRQVLDYDTYMYKYLAAFGRLNYQWDKKYIINLTARRDGSSRFASGRQFGDFGALGLAWLFSKEKWMDQYCSFLSFGKLRGSYGIAGNDQIGNYQFLDTYGTSAGPATSYNGVTALDPTRLYNPVFGWESNKKLEAALELAFFDNRISLSASWYQNRSSNQLVNFTLPSTTGFGGILANLPATVQNTGIEMELATGNIKSKNLTWTSSFNLTIPSNKLIAFPNIASSSYANQYIVGQPIYIQKFYEYTGIDPQTGLYTVRDVDQDGKISAPPDDIKAVFIGQDFYGGLGNNFSHRNWSLDIFLQFVKQTGILATFLPGLQDRNLPAYIFEEKRWQKPGDQAEIQRFATDYSMGFGGALANSPYEQFATSDAVVTDASFIRLKTVSLAYQLPSSLFKGIIGQFYIRGQNLLVITKYKASDPEVQRSGWVLPPLRIITVGLNITL